MVRHATVFITCGLLLAACGPSSGGRLAAENGRPAAMDMVAPGGAPATPQQFSYSHAWSLLMAHAAVGPRFERAHDACLKDASLNCKLISANIETSDSGDAPYSLANLQVLLPHGKLEMFEKALLTPVAGESPGDVTVHSKSTRADSVENAAGDVALKVKQLTAYRDRLAALAARPNLSIDEIIRVESEQARVQGDLDDALGRQRDIGDGIARETLSVDLTERVVSEGPIARVWRHGADLFADSAASALQFLVQIVPWLPILAAGLFAVSWLWRLFRRRREKAA
jgi:hypothetical protein